MSCKIVIGVLLLHLIVLIPVSAQLAVVNKEGGSTAQVGSDDSASSDTDSNTDSSDDQGATNSDTSRTLRTSKPSAVSDAKAAQETPDAADIGSTNEGMAQSGDASRTESAIVIRMQKRERVTRILAKLDMEPTSVIIRDIRSMDDSFINTLEQYIETPTRQDQIREQVRELENTLELNRTISVYPQREQIRQLYAQDLSFDAFLENFW